ncbi:hypothetical protein C8Q72DRAFT_354601 [Fomitopsis betulina]|nr:hypothetical protein C8Q72DRAFT_354601 [Fomitopsis betulina]
MRHLRRLRQRKTPRHFPDGAAPLAFDLLELLALPLTCSSDLSHRHRRVCLCQRHLLHALCTSAHSLLVGLEACLCPPGARSSSRRLPLLLAGDFMPSTHPRRMRPSRFANERLSSPRSSPPLASTGGARFRPFAPPAAFRRRFPPPFVPSTLGVCIQACRTRSWCRTTRLAHGKRTSSP